MVGKGAGFVFIGVAEQPLGAAKVPSVLSRVWQVGGTVPVRSFPTHKNNGMKEWPENTQSSHYYALTLPGRLLGRRSPHVSMYNTSKHANEMLVFCLDDSVPVVLLSINKVKVYVQLNNRSKNKNFEGQVMD